MVVQPFIWRGMTTGCQLTPERLGIVVEAFRLERYDNFYIK